MPMRMTPPSSLDRLHDTAASEPTAIANRDARRNDRMFGNATDRVRDLMTPDVGGHFEDEVPDPGET